MELWPLSQGELEGSRDSFVERVFEQETALTRIQAPGVRASGIRGPFPAITLTRHVRPCATWGIRAPRRRHGHSGNERRSGPPPDPTTPGLLSTIIPMPSTDPDTFAVIRRGGSGTDPPPAFIPPMHPLHLPAYVEEGLRSMASSFGAHA